MYNNRNIINDRYIEECRNDLLQMNGGTSSTESTSQNRSTKTDNKLKANLSIRELSDRLKNVVSELKLLHEMFSSDVENYTNRDRQGLLSELIRTIIPFLENTSTKIINNADCLAPIPGTKYVHSIQENKRKRETELSTTKKRIPMRMIQNSMNIPCLHKENTVGKRKVKKRTSLPTIILPIPLNEKMYTKPNLLKRHDICNLAI